MSAQDGAGSGVPDRPGWHDGTHWFACPTCAGPASYRQRTFFSAPSGHQMLYLGWCGHCGPVIVASAAVPAGSLCLRCAAVTYRTTPWDLPEGPDEFAIWCPACGTGANVGALATTDVGAGALVELHGLDAQLYELRIHRHRYGANARYLRANGDRTRFLEWRRHRQREAAIGVVGDGWVYVDVDRRNIAVADPTAP